MRKETGDLIWSWFVVLWFTLVPLYTTYVGFVYGISSVTFVYTFSVHFAVGVFVVYVTYKAIKKKEFRLRLKTKEV